MDRSSALFNEAKNYISGGVNSPVRAFKGVGGEPIYFERGEGAYLYDVDGKDIQIHLLLMLLRLNWIKV